MNDEIIMPNYNNSILNMVNSVLKYYNVKTNHSTLPKLDAILEKKYKNVVIVLLDGMGENVLRKASPNGIFSKNRIDTITSVYPCTTTAALTTYYTGKAPIETGWLAWSQYFKEYGRAVDMFPYVDSYTGEPLSRDKFDAYEILKYTTTYEQISKASPNVISYEIKPSHCDMKHNKCIHIKDLEGLCNSIETLCKNDQEKYVFAYYDSPDNINHKYGWNSKNTKQFIMHAESLFKQLENNLKGTDTLLIISADHGHTSINKNYNAMELEDLTDCFIMPPYFEPRFLSFLIKYDKKDYFEKKFREKFEGEFLLYSKEEFMNSNLLGYGNKHKKVDDFIGDYIAIAISEASIKLGTYLSNEKPLKLSDHCGLTKNEMEVPLIIFDLK